MSRSLMIFSMLFSAMLFPIDAYAYLDPGTGSALLQGLLGVIAATAVVLKLYWHRLLRFLGIRKNQPKEHTESNK